MVVSTTPYNFNTCMKSGAQQSLPLGIHDGGCRIDFQGKPKYFGWSEGKREEEAKK